MAVLSTIWFSLLALLGLSIRPDAPASDGIQISPVCFGNQVHTDCGVRCEKTCENWDKPIACPADCFPGCVCKAGLVRDGWGECVSPQECRSNTIEKAVATKSCSEMCEKLCRFSDLRWRCVGPNKWKCECY